jgi:TP901 family phage tail tape measure protein
MRILYNGDDGGGGGGESAPKIERIQLVVECPSQNFASQGGLFDLIQELEKADKAFEAFRSKLKSGLNFAGAGGSVSATGEIKLTISGSAIHAALAPGEKIALNLKGADFTVGGSAAGAGCGSGTGAPYSTPPLAPGSPGAPSYNLYLKQEVFKLENDIKLLREQRFHDPITGQTLIRGQITQTPEGKDTEGELTLIQRTRQAEDAERQRQYRAASINAELQASQAMHGIGPGADAVRRRQEAQIDIQKHSQKYDFLTGMAAKTHGDEHLDWAQKAQVQYGELVKAMRAANIETERFDQSNRLIGKNMLQNIKHVTTWATSVGILYGSIHILTRSLEENMEIDKQMAILSQIFKAPAADVEALTNNVLKLATANGQSAKEAIESATEWARIFHTEQEIIVATDASLKLANVSGMEAAKTTEYLGMMVQVYGLHASQLNSVIGEMAALSQTANIANVDLIKGMDAVAEAAKQAGMSYSETMGIITGGVAMTKQSGTTIANTAKTMITQMANPEIQEKMRLGFGLEVTQGGGSGDIKNMTQIFQEMFVAWEKMNEAERRSMLFSIGGRQNASRMAGILDGFIMGQVKAIQAQLNLNSAEQENEKIVATLKGQVAALVAEWDRFINLQGNMGPMLFLTDLTKSLKELLQLGNQAPGLVATFGALGTALAARLTIGGVMGGAAKSAEMGMKGGVLVSTFRAIGNDVKALGNIFNQVAEHGGARKFEQLLLMIPFGTRTASAGIAQMSLAVRGLGVAFATVGEVILPILAAWYLIHEFNKHMDANSGASVIDGLSAEGERAAGAASSRQASGDIIKMAEDALKSPATPMGEKRAIARQIAGAELPGGSSSEIAQLAAQNEAYVKQGNLIGLIADMEAHRAERLGGITIELGKHNKALDGEIDLRREADSRAEYQEKHPWASRFGTFVSWAKAAGQIEHLPTVPYDAFFESNPNLRPLSETKEANQQALNAKIAQRQKEIQDEMERKRTLPTNEDWTQSLIGAGSIGASRELAMKNIGSEFGAIPAFTETEKRNRELAELNRKGMLLASEHGYYLGGGINRSTAEGGIENTELREKMQREYRDDIVANQVAVNRMNLEGGASAGRQDRMGIYGNISHAEYGSLAIGLTPGEQMEHQFNEADLRRRNYIRADVQTSGGDQAARMAAMTMGVEMEQTRLNAVEKIYETEKEIANVKMAERRDYQRSLLTSGPGELLRKLAVNQLTQGGTRDLTGGQFFAMSVQAREDYLRMPGHTMQDRQLQNSLRALRNVTSDSGSTNPTTRGLARMHQAADYALHSPINDASISAVVRFTTALHAASDLLEGHARGVATPTVPMNTPTPTAATSPQATVSTGSSSVQHPVPLNGAPSPHESTSLPPGTTLLPGPLHMSQSTW